MSVFVLRLFKNTPRLVNFHNFTLIHAGTQQLIARSGYSRQGGFEIYLQGAELGGDLWDTIWQAGQSFNVSPGCPNLIERIEGGLLSYGNEMTIENNPLELGLDQFCSLDKSTDCIGIDALKSIASSGVNKHIRGVLFDGGPCPSCAKPWPVFVNDTQVGQITSGIWSPRLKRNIGLSLIHKDFWEVEKSVTVHSSDGQIRSGEISQLPFH